MTASIWVPLMAGAMVFFALVVVGLVVGGYFLWRLGRRKWRAFHAHGAVVGAMALWEATSTVRFRPRTSGAMADVTGWTPRQVRKEMWRSVDRANAAVRAAEEVDAPTASLPSLCRRLQDAATALDRVLRVESQGPVPSDVASQATEVMDAASSIQAAAVAAASDANGHRVRELTRDADHEIQILDAGLASVRAVLPRRER